MVVFRINRYIMECKSKAILLRYRRRLELIDTLWNVNRFTVDKKLSGLSN